MKGKKRNVDESCSADDGAAAIAQSIDNEKERKRAKRLRKQQLLEAESGAQQANEDNDGNDDNDDNDEAAQRKLEKKLKKKLKKEQQKAELLSTVAAETEASEGKAQKKDKMKFKSGSDDGANFYRIHADVEQVRDAAALRSERNITLTLPPSLENDASSGTLTLLTAFDHLSPSLSSHCDYIMRYFQKKNFPSPSPIQVPSVTADSHRLIVHCAVHLII